MFVRVNHGGGQTIRFWLVGLQLQQHSFALLKNPKLVDGSTSIPSIFSKTTQARKRGSPIHFAQLLSRAVGATTRADVGAHSCTEHGVDIENQVIIRCMGSREPSKDGPPLAKG